MNSKRISEIILTDTACMGGGFTVSLRRSGMTRSSSWRKNDGVWEHSEETAACAHFDKLAYLLAAIPYDRLLPVYDVSLAGVQQLVIVDSSGQKKEISGFDWAPPELWAAVQAIRQECLIAEWTKTRPNQSSQLNASSEHAMCCAPVALATRVAG